MKQITLAEVKQHVHDFFGDTSRSKEATKDGLEEISELADSLAESIDTSDDNDEG